MIKTLYKIFGCWILKKHHPTHLLGNPNYPKYCADCNVPLDEMNKSMSKSRKQIRFESLVRET